VATTYGARAVFPPVHFHPDNVGELGGAPASRSLKRPDGDNLLGCDLNGRDVAARLLYGTRISLTIGLVAVAIYVTIGVILGSLAGYYRGRVDLWISRLVEVMICFPTMFLLLTIVAIFESRSIFLIMAAIGLVGWPGVTRLVRGEFLRQSSLDYVTAAKALGLPERRVIFGHLLPNCVGPVLVSATFGIAGAILTESGLAFLGLGDTTAASWGQMLNSGRSEGQWHLIVAPGFAIFFVVTVFNLLGEGLRDALDPKLRR
jgi:peptide/nickel transport system permease protein